MSGRKFPAENQKDIEKHRFINHLLFGVKTVKEIYV